MKRATSVRTPGFATRVTCAAVLAGTCLFAPGLALAASASASAAPDAPSASVSALKDAQGVTLGKVGMDVPGDWSVVELGDVMVVASSPDGLMTASLVSVADEKAPAPGSAELEAYLADAAQRCADGLAGELKGAASVELADGAEGYACVIDATQAETGSMVYLVYVPEKAGVLTTVMICAAPEVTDGEDVADAIAQTVSASVKQPAAKAASGARDASVALDVTGEGGGITLGLPDGMLAEDGDPEMPSWVSEDGCFMVGVIPDVTEGEGTFTAEEMDMCAQLVAGMFGGEVLGSTTTGAKDATVMLYAYAFAQDDEVFMGAIGFVPVADGSLTAIMAICTGEQAEMYGAVMDAMFASVSLA